MQLLTPKTTMNTTTTPTKLLFLAFPGCAPETFSGDAVIEHSPMQRNAVAGILSNG
jgi:hypothetical protein